SDGAPDRGQAGRSGWTAARVFAAGPGSWTRRRTRRPHTRSGRAAGWPGGLGNVPGLRLLEGEAVEHDGLVILEFGKERHANGDPHGFLGNGVPVVAVTPGERHTATLALVGPLGAHPRIAGALLPEQFLARAGHVGAAAGVDSPDPARRLVHEDDVV